MIESLLQLDKELFLFLNGIHHPFADPIMVFISGKLTWIPFYTLIIYFIIKTFKWETVRVLLFVALLIGLSDQLSVQAFKLYFQRMRPCHEDDLQPFIHIVNNKCGGSFGFVSSHAANSFALAGFIFFLLKPHFKNIGWIIFSWASVVSYSRIYLGVHYPGDILGGAILGLLVSLIVWQMYLFSQQYICRNNC